MIDVPVALFNADSFPEFQDSSNKFLLVLDIENLTAHHCAIFCGCGVLRGLFTVCASLLEKSVLRSSGVSTVQEFSMY